MSTPPHPAAGPAAQPMSAEPLLRRGFALHQAGDVAGAEAVYRRALAIDPRDHRGLTLLAGLLEMRGDAKAAETLYRQAVAVAPEAPAARLQLASLCLRQDAPAEALALILPYVNGRPADPKGWRIRARAAHALGDMKDAADSYARALAAGDASAAAPLAHMLQAAEDWAGAAEAYERALPLEPENASLHGALGNVYSKLKRSTEAIARYRRAIELDPKLIAAQSALGLELHQIGDYAEAAVHYERALAMADTPAAKADILNNLANVRLAQGEIRQAQSLYRDLLAEAPAYPAAARNLCMAIAYDDDADAETLANICAAAVAGMSVASRPPLGATDGRALRIGFVSADLRSHSVAAFVEPLFRCFDPNEIECHAYALASNPDRITDRLKGLASGWRDAAKWSDREICEAVRADGVDILIDLAGHTGDARLGVFAARPAPVQATWLGWPATTGLKAIDFKLSDALLTPPGATEAFTEQTLNLAGPVLCFQPPDDAPPPAPPPMLANGYPTFGSFNRIFKASPRTLRLWAAVLAAVPGSRMLLKDAAFRCPKTTAGILGRMAAAGIDLKRVTTLGSTPDRASHLELYSRVDVALDSVPYNGVTTTSEALWMGVPAVTLVGDRSLARHGLTVLTHAGLAECVATDEAGFIERARNLVADPNALTARRRDIRRDLAKSALLDGPAFAANFAAACREMVRRVRAAGD